MNSPRRRSPAAVRPQSLHAQLKALILSGKLRPGERLVERELARRFGVSRIPLRESLVRLEAEGLVRSVTNTATYVEDFSPQDTVEVYSLRLLLEPLGTRLAAFRSTAELVRCLRRICDRMTQLTRLGDWIRLDQADYEFHRTAVAASGHRRLLRAYDFCQIQILGGGGVSEQLAEWAPDFTAKEHERILRAIERGDAAAAEKFSRAHVERAMQGFLKYHGFIVRADAGVRLGD